jgi:hypothetical protein
MKRTHLIAALAGLMALGAFAGDASAYYHPGMGRFMSRDPGVEAAMRIGAGGSAVVGGFMPRDPTGQYADGMNLYQYVRSSPVLLIDPLGLSALFSYKASLKTEKEQVFKTYTGENLNFIDTWATGEMGRVDISSTYSYTYAFKKTANSTNMLGADECCKDKKPPDIYEVTGASIQVRYLQELYMPQWSTLAQATKADQAAWSDWIRRLRAHEQGHMDINSIFAAQLVNGATEQHDIHFASCDRNEKYNKGILSRMVEKAIQSDLSYLQGVLAKWHGEYHDKVGSNVPFYAKR